jgi:ribosomal protein L7Ae-like RNA K-turn-binding protein
VVEEFKLHARERKFVVREFSYNEADLAAGKNEITKLVTDKKKQFVSYLSTDIFGSFRRPAGRVV